MDNYIPHGHRKKANKIFVYGKKKNRYYCGDRRLYREEYLKSEHWKQLRSEKLKLNPVCEECGRPDFVEPHHLEYKNLYDVLVTDLKTLCRACHDKKHDVVKRHRKKFVPRNIFRNRTRLINYVSRRTHIDSSVISAMVSKLKK